MRKLHPLAYPVNEVELETLHIVPPGEKKCSCCGESALQMRFRYTDSQDLFAHITQMSAHHKDTHPFGMFDTELGFVVPVKTCMTKAEQSYGTKRNYVHKTANASGHSVN